MNRKEILSYALASSLALLTPAPSNRQEDPPYINIQPIVSAYALTLEVGRNDTILRAGSVLFYGDDPRIFPAQGALIAQEQKYYLWTVKHALKGFQQGRIGVYLPTAGSFNVSPKDFSMRFSKTDHLIYGERDDIVALELGKARIGQAVQQQKGLDILLPLQLRIKRPEVGQMVAIPNPETGSYSYRRIIDLDRNLATLIEDTRYSSPPMCTGQSGAPVLYVDETGTQPKLTNEVIGAHTYAFDQYKDQFGRLCTHSKTLAQLHDRFRE